MYKKQLMFFMSIAMLFSAFFFGCNEDKFDAGIDLVPDSLKIKTNATDTFSVVAYTDTIGALQTENVSKILVGKYTDPILGEISASFVTQLIPSNINADSILKQNSEADSLVIYLRFPASGLKTYGDSTGTCKIDIMRVNKYLDDVDTYYHIDSIAASDLTPLMSINLNPTDIFQEADDVYEAALADTAGGNVPDSANLKPIPILSIKLSDAVRDEVFELIGTSIGGGQTFAQEFGGLYFKPNSDTISNTLSIFDYLDQETKAVLYYKTDLTDSLEYTLALNSSTTRFNLFEHTYNIDVLDNLGNNQDSVVYVHGIAGLRTKIFFPDIEELKKQGRYAVNRAELFLTAESSSLTHESDYPAPTSLYLTRINDDGIENGLQEYSSQDGYTAIDYIDGKYIFDITLYIQKILDGEINNNGLILRLPDENVNPSRVILTSGIHTNKMQLILTLTKLSD